MIVRTHRLSPNGKWCLFCGAKFNADMDTFGSAATCVPRDDGVDSNALRPEPALRKIACEDGGTISARIIELAAERAEAMNHVEPEAAPEPQPDFDYGCG